METQDAAASQKMEVERAKEEDEDEEEMSSPTASQKTGMKSTLHNTQLYLLATARSRLVKFCDEVIINQKPVIKVEEIMVDNPFEDDTGQDWTEEAKSPSSCSCPSKETQLASVYSGIIWSSDSLMKWVPQLGNILACVLHILFNRSWCRRQ